MSPWARLAQLTGRGRALEGDAQNLLVRDSFADLVVHRGFIFCWPDQLAGLKEAYGLLETGGRRVCVVRRVQAA